MQSITRSMCSFTPALRNILSVSRCTCSYSQSLVDRVASRQRRSYSTEALAAPTPEGEDRAYSPKIQGIVQEISQLTLLEVADLNDLLKKTLKITDAPMMAMGSAAAPVAAAEEEAVEEVAPAQALFTVKLTQFDPTKKVALIKQIKSMITGMNLVQAKKFVEATPADVKIDVTKEEGEAIKKEIEAAGGTVELV